MPLRVLVVDDEASMRTIIELMLRADGHTVGLAGDGAEALQKFEAEPWDAVVTDYQMPHMDGEALSREVKARAPSTRVIVITGLMRAVSFPGADAILRKPFARAALLAALRPEQPSA